MRWKVKLIFITERTKLTSPPKEKVPRKTVTHSPYTVNQLKEWLKDTKQTVNFDDKTAVDQKVGEMKYVRGMTKRTSSDKGKANQEKSIMEMNANGLKLLNLSLNLSKYVNKFC